MIKQQKLEELIREKMFLGNPDTRGFYSFKCQCCNDYKVRAGVKFENDTVIYNCWNCGTASVYEEFSGSISKKMRNILHAYDIEDGEINQVINTSFFNKKEDGPKVLTLASLQKVSTHTPTIHLPLQTYKLGDIAEHLDQQQAIMNYLVRRNVDLDRYSFFFSTLPRFKDRVIIPFYRNGSLIYWQARSINPDEKKRYDNCISSRDAVLFNFDQLNTFAQAPLFVSEGIFDAMMFNGVAVLGSKLSDAKLELLNNTRRRLVFIIDKDKNGGNFAELIIQCGWDITFVPDGADDLNKSVMRFGRAWTAQQLIKNIPADKDAARLAIQINCFR